ncbi:melanoma-associated antigen E1-like [Glossophaga mutica]
MPRGHKSKLRAREKRRQNRAETQSLKSAEATAGEEEEAACSSSSVLGDAPSSSTGAGPLQASLSTSATSSTAAGVSCERSGKVKGHGSKSKNSSGASASTGIPGKVLLNKKATQLVEYLMYQYKRKEPIRKADMLNIVHKWCRKDFPEILRKASERINLFFGLELKEVKPNGNYYILVDSQGDTSDGSLSRAWRFPIKGILMPLLSMIFLNGNRASEEETWEFLNNLGIYDGKSHLIFGEPRKLITQDLVQEKYLVYQQVVNSDPPCFEFLWGPRAHAESSKMKVLQFLAKLNDSEPTAFPDYYEEALKDEEERVQPAPRASTPSKAQGAHQKLSTELPPGTQEGWPSSHREDLQWDLRKPQLSQSEGEPTPHPCPALPSGSERAQESCAAKFSLESISEKAVLPLRVYLDSEDPQHAGVNCFQGAQITFLLAHTPVGFPEKHPSCPVVTRVSSVLVRNAARTELRQKVLRVLRLLQEKMQRPLAAPLHFWQALPQVPLVLVLSRHPRVTQPPPVPLQEFHAKEVLEKPKAVFGKHQMKEPIRKTDMLKIVHKWYRKDFPEILKMASDHMDLVYGLELKEVKPNGNFYTLIQNEDATSDESLSRVWRFPIKGILMPLLSVIFLNGNRTPEEEIWEFLKMMGIHDGKSHFIFGDTRKLITQDLVQEEYLVYQQVANSNPPRYEFLWGPRAHAETSKMKILEFVAKMNDRVPTAFPAYYQEALKDEEERARAAPRASSPAKASGHPTATSSHRPQPE